MSRKVVQFHLNINARNNELLGLQSARGIQLGFHILVLRAISDQPCLPDRLDV